MLPCPPPRDLPNPGIQSRPPALQADSLPSELPGKPYGKVKKKKYIYIYIYIYICIHTYIHTHIFAVFQWLRTCLPVQRTQFQALVGEGPTCRGAPKPVHLTEAFGPRAAAPQQENPPQREAHAPRLEAAPSNQSCRRPVSSNEDRAELK